MTEEQKKARKLSAESGNIRWIKDNCLRTKYDKEDYVFISYKSDDYERVLDDILYKTCKKYGLKVYFDTAFDDDSDSWITQYYDNMCSKNCKAFIAFINDNYYSSYACLLEMMSRKTEAAGGDYREDSLFFIPINIGSITSIVDDSNTGLGTKRFKSGKINRHAEIELEKFNDIFLQVASERIKNATYKCAKEAEEKKQKGEKIALYEEACQDDPHEYGKMFLNVTQCRKIMEYVIPKNNDNDGSNKDFTEVIHDKLLKRGIFSVFKGGEKTIDNPIQESLSTSTPIVISEPNEKTSVIDNSEKIVSANESYVGVVNKSTLLKDFEKLCESVDFCVALGNARSNIRHGGKGLFDYLMAALLRGCDADIYDKKNNRIVRLAGYNYNKYAVAENPDDPKTSDIQYPWTWTTNCRKSIKKEDIPKRFFNEKGKVKSGRLEDFNKIFEELEPETSIGEVLEKFEKCEKGFDTKDNKLILEAWDLIESINLNSGKKGLQEIL